MSHDIDEKCHNGQFRLQTQELQIIARDWPVGLFQNHGVHIIEMVVDGTRGWQFMFVSRVRVVSSYEY